MAHDVTSTFIHPFPCVVVCSTSNFKLKFSYSGIFRKCLIFWPTNFSNNKVYNTATIIFLICKEYACYISMGAILKQAACMYKI